MGVMEQVGSGTFADDLEHLERACAQMVAALTFLDLRERNIRTVLIPTTAAIEKDARGLSLAASSATSSIFPAFVERAIFVAIVTAKGK